MKTKKLQYEVSNERLEDLENMMKEGDVHTKRDLLNSALTLLEWAMNESRQGRIILSADETNGNVKEIILPILTAARRSRKQREAQQVPRLAAR